MAAARHRRAARAYFVTRAIVQRATLLVGAVFEGAWLGFASTDLLHAIDEAYYDGEAQYVDAVYNEGGLHEWETSAIEAHFAPGSRVAVTAIGGGRELLALLRMGYDAVGFEPHARLAAAAAALVTAHGWSDRVHPMPRDGWPPGHGTFDGVVLGWGSYMLVPSRPRRVAFLREVRSALEPDAPVLLSFFPRDREGRYADTVVRVANVIRSVRRQEPVTLGDRLVPNLVHYFSRDEIDAELRDGGFELVAFERSPYGHAVGVAR